MDACSRDATKAREDGTADLFAEIAAAAWKTMHYDQYDL